jgi:hypothetical protein
MQSQAIVLGRQRNPGVVILLMIVTLGIYQLVWFYQLFSEARAYVAGRNGVKVTSGGAAIGFLFIPLFGGIWAIMLMFKTPGLVTRMREADGVPEHLRGSTGLLGLLVFLPLLGAILWIIFTQGAINSFWRDAQQRCQVVAMPVGHPC